MAQSFDPYAQWLGVTSPGRPVDHYALLGVTPFESNVGAIEDAFHQRYRDVRRYQVGEHGEMAVRILQELAKAFDCLSQPASKLEYDAQLAKRTGRPAPRPAPTNSRNASSAPPATPHEPQRSTAGAEPGERPIRPPSAEHAVSSRLAGYWVMDRDRQRRAGPFTFDQLCAAVEQGKLPGDAWLLHGDWPKPRLATSVFPELGRAPRIVPVSPEEQDAWSNDAGLITDLSAAVPPAPYAQRPAPLGLPGPARGRKRPIALYLLLAFTAVAICVFVGVMILLIRTLTNDPSIRNTANRIRSQAGFNRPMNFGETGEMVDLMTMTDPNSDFVRFPWRRVGDALRSPPAGPTQLHLRYSAPQKYRLLIEAKRVEGIDSFNVALPVGGNQVVGLIDGHGGATTGLSLVRRASGDRNGTAVMGRRFDDQDYHIVEYYVTPSSITLYFDGVYVFTWEGDSRDLSVDTRFWTPVFQRDVLVGSWSSSFDFRRIELYPAR
ncbi:MAG: hypothetical protein KDA83_08260 [Planctomycetales bacterium]|nr:hypothetical protein [Planctomycetales bacterium]